jgi:uncharacterized protein
MSHDFHDAYTCFAGERLIAGGPAEQVARAAAAAEDAGLARIVIFEDRTGRQVELDRRGAAPTLAGASTPIEEDAPRVASGRGRPRLGVVAREVTLLPRHWQWLETQPGGASAALRRLVDEARRTRADKDRAGEAQQATYRVMSVLAGNLPQFEEATRALFARDDVMFDAIVVRWPDDVRTYVSRLAAAEREVRVARAAMFTSG